MPVDAAAARRLEPAIATSASASASASARAAAPAPAPWGRTNRLILEAVERLGGRGRGISARHTDQFLVLEGPPGNDGTRSSVVVCKTRSPWLTQQAQHLANNKFVSREHFAAAGLPVLPQVLVDTLPLEGEAQAFLAHHRRLVVKPNWGNRGLGLVPDVATPAQLDAAVQLAIADDFDEEAVLEPQRQNAAHLRVAVIGGKFVAACLVEHLTLVGDGEHTIAELLERVNQDPRRGAYDDGALTPLDQVEPLPSWETELGAVHGRNLATVLSVGATQPVWFEEAETIDVTAQVPARIRQASEQACAVLGVDVGGVDWLGAAGSQQRPSSSAGQAGMAVAQWQLEGMALLEVNVLPALHLHALPTQGAAQPVFEAFVRYVLGLR